MHVPRWFWLLGLGSAMFVGCSRETPTPAVAPPEVIVAQPIVRTDREYKDFTGSIEAVESAEIRARVEGFLEKIHFEPSAEVEADQLLFEIEKAPYEAEVERAKKSVELRSAELARAEAQLARDRRLLQSNSVSKAEYDERVADRDMAKAAVGQAEASLDQSEIQLGYTTIRTPIPGVVAREFVDAGNLVGSSERTLLTRIHRIDQVHVYFEVDEPTALQISRRRLASGKQRSDDTIPISVGLVDEGDTHPHPGVIDYVDNELDRSTGTIEVRALLENPKGILYPGLFARVRLEADEKEMILVEEKAIGTDLAGKFLLIVGENDIVENRPIQLGQRYGVLRAVTEGISTDERYIVEGLRRARPGLPVSAKKQKDTPSQPESPEAEPESQAESESESEKESETEPVDSAEKDDG